ncbi:response regulator [Nitrosopumilus ureiphilus]|uniref:Response regulator n=1 Tax=Nitrosopumilus ureiphilus TaxID=1470067 RepID=A0A7D5M5A6_9ARCH|nr:response regulator [Nitrosopumilus ureiphilus]QLH06893.1 response regulator [Nitrosopumilus ureiphilus]
MSIISGIIVDDEQDIVDVVSQFLELKGYAILGKGNNGCQAVTMYKELKPNFVILDMKMPQYDGNYAIREIKKIDPNAKIFIMTGYSKYEHLENDVNAVFTKPCDMKKLVETIEFSCLV